MKKLLLILLCLPLIGFGQKEPRKSWSDYEKNKCVEEMIFFKELAKQNSLPAEQFVQCICEQLEKKYSSYYEVSKIEKWGEQLAAPLITPCVSDDFSESKCLEGDCINGTGKFLLAPGQIYEGKFKNGLPHGKGKLIMDGVEGSGKWKNGKKNGKFILRNLKSGEETELYFVDDVLKQ